MLIVQGDGEGHGPVHHVRRRRHAGHVALVHDSGGDGLYTERARWLAVEIEEMLAPNLHGRASILRAVRRLNRAHLGVFVVPEFSRISHILECSVERDHKRDLDGIARSQRWTVFALDAHFVADVFRAFLLVELKLPFLASHVGSANGNIAEFAFWLRVIDYVRGEWSASDYNFGVAGAWALGRLDALDLDPRFS